MRKNKITLQKLKIKFMNKIKKQKIFNRKKISLNNSKIY